MYKTIRCKLLGENILMKKLTQVELQQQGYQFVNAQITDVELSMATQDSLVLWLTLKGNGWSTNFGGYSIGRGHLDAEEFLGTPKGSEQIMRTMDLVGVNSFKELVGSYVRVAIKPGENYINIIGNIIIDKWFDIVDFFTTKETEKPIAESTEEQPAAEEETTEEEN
jgi:hypothetical protein